MKCKDGSIYKITVPIIIYVPIMFVPAIASLPLVAFGLLTALDGIIINVLLIIITIVIGLMGRFDE